MTRFLITLPEAIELVDIAMTDAPSGVIYVRKSPSASVGQFIRAMAPDHPTVTIGVRPGEKMHEDLIAAHEFAVDCGDYFVVRRNVPGGKAYTSLDAPIVTDDAIREMIAQAPDDL
jgi:FlaA1/EpsC-like NDP-sugar epimerase